MRDSLLWLTQDLADVPEHNDWLSGKERSVLSRLRVPKRRNDWILGRWTAKRAYRIYQPSSTLRLADMNILAAEDGGPDLYIGESAAQVRISISHSSGRGFCVLSPGDCPVGCDLERMESRPQDFFEDYFGMEEILFWRGAPEALRPLVAYLIWSAKESCLKILREGLRRDTRSIRITFPLDDEVDAWHPWTGRCLETSAVFHGWWRCEDEFVYTVGSELPSSPPRKLEDGPNGCRCPS